MANAIDTLKTLLAGKVSDTRSKLSVYKGEENQTELNCIILYYTDDTSYVSTSKAKYYSIGIQVVVRHNDNESSRNSAYAALEYIRANSHNTSGIYYILNQDSVPHYLGVDSKKGHMWSFDMYSKGSK